MVHPNTIPHYYANRQELKTHYYANALKDGYVYKKSMKKSDIKLAIAEYQRAAIKKVMAELGLKQSPWCAKAGISESSLRNFLNGDSESMQSNHLQMLADAAGISIGKLFGSESENDSKEAIIYILKEILDILLNKRQATTRQLEDDFIYGRVQFGTIGLLNAENVMDHLLAHVRDESPPETLDKILPLVSLSPPRLVK